MHLWDLDTGEDTVLEPRLDSVIWGMTFFDVSGEGRLDSLVALSKLGQLAFWS